MLANPHTKFTPFEKKALCAFGCTDKEITLENLDAVATMAHHKETAARFDRLISKLKREVFPGYRFSTPAPPSRRPTTSRRHWPTKRPPGTS